MSTRRWTTLGAAALLVLVAAACQPWPQFMGNPALTGDDSGESTLTTANVATLVPDFTVPVVGAGHVFGPTISGGVVYAAGYSASHATLTAASNSGSNCSGAPEVCAPTWTASLGTYDDLSSPLISGGVVYETASYQDDHATGMLAAYDAAGVSGCSGAPKVCTPLWTAPLTAAWGPNVANGRVYVDDVDTGRLEVFDAAGSTECSGAPKVCTPLWTASGTSTGVPSVANGKVYLTTTLPGVEVFDAAGSTGCSGSPTVCTPLFTVPLPGNTTGSVAVSGGTGYVQQSGFPNDGHTGLYAFDAAGAQGCTGTPVVCQPLWRGDGTGFAVTNTPAVVGNRVYMGVLASYPSTGSLLEAFDATGATGCSGTPVVCQPLFTGATPTGRYQWTSPTVTAHVVFMGGDAYDASGSAGCSGTPVMCTPLWSVSSGIYSSTAVNNGVVYVGGDDGLVHAYRLPTS